VHLRFLTRLLLLVAFVAATAFGDFLVSPYLQNLTDSSIVIRWESDTAQDGKVQYGLTSGYGSEVSQADSTMEHELTLTGLDADTVYHYRAVSGPDASLDCAFRSFASGNRPFRFFAYGDNRSDYPAHESVVARMCAQSPLPGFALSSGDLTYNGALPLYDAFFIVERGLLSRLPVFPALGNHDADSITNWQRFFALPGNERWYSFRYGNSAFLCLDNYSDYAPGSTQYDWLVSELQADSADLTVRHTFVCFHEPPYTTSTGHPSNLDVRQYLCPLFEQYHVAITFQGHVHCYEHALVNGVHYIVTGGGGAPLYHEWNPPQPWDIYRETTLEFVMVEVDGDIVRSHGVRPDGTEFDSLTLVPASVRQSPNAEVRIPNSGIRLHDVLNPTSRVVQFSFTLPSARNVDALLYDVTGRPVAKLAHGLFAEGNRTVVWDGSRLGPGPYLLVLQSDGHVDVEKVVVVEE
jgi:hypothetical protein